MSEPTPRSSRDPEGTQAMVARVVDEVLQPATRHEKAALVRLVMSSLRHHDTNDVNDLEKVIRGICRMVVPSILGPQYSWPEVRKHVENAALNILQSRHHRHYDDLVGATLEKLSRRKPGKKPVRSLKKLVKTVCLGEWKRLYKKSQRIPSDPLEGPNSEIASARAEEEFKDVDDADLLERFGRRSPKHRQWAALIKTRYGDGVTQADMARERNLSSSAMSQQMTKAKAAFEKFLDDDNNM